LYTEFDGLILHGWVARLNSFSLDCPNIPNHPQTRGLLIKYPKCKFVESAVLRTGDVKPPTARIFSPLSRMGGLCVRRPSTPLGMIFGVTQVRTLLKIDKVTYWGQPKC